MTASETKWVYRFGDGHSEGTAEMKNLLGGKGANLAEMCNLEVPVPPGFTITTEVCTAFYDNGEHYPESLSKQIQDATTYIENIAGAKFGDADKPLLVSVRSGARVSMPGMMDTVLNLGLNDVTVEGLAKSSGDARFAYDSYRRFIQMYGNVVMGLEHHDFEDILDNFKDANGYLADTEISADEWKEIIIRFKASIADNHEEMFPQDVNDQLWGAINAVFGSWESPRANTYRTLNDIPAGWGTAVNVQAMVFGNMGDTSATGVAFTRDPSNGTNELYGEFLVNAQGEDVVAGIRTPQNITELARKQAGSTDPSLEALMPQTYVELIGIFDKLEAHYKDMQDMEFTIQDGKLWMLQTRAGKRTTSAAIKIAVDMANEGLISQDEAVMRVDPASLDQLLHPTLDPKAERNVLATGLPASPGAACGEVVFSSEDAERLKGAGHEVILVRIETSPDDIHGMHAANGILTARGGMTSHAAVVARGMGKSCVSGAGDVKIDYDAETFTTGDVTIAKGDIITIDGSSGEVMKGAVATIKPELSGDFDVLMGMGR